MLQRATLAVTAIMAAAGVVACVMLGMVLEQNRTVNAAILQSLQNVSAPAAELKSLEWNPVKVRVVSGKPGGPPMEGVQVTLNGDIVGTSKSKFNGSFEQTTDKNGLADFGLVRPGYFTLTTISPWSESMSKMLTVRPGTAEPYEIVCPAGPRKEADVTVTVDWPDELKDKKLWLIADFVLDAHQVDREYWVLPRGETLMMPAMYSPGMQSAGARSLFLSPNGQQTYFPLAHNWRQSEKTLQIEPQRLVFSDGKSMELKGLLSWPEGTVRLVALAVVQAATAKGGGVVQERLPFLNRTEYQFAEGTRAAAMGFPPAAKEKPAPTFRVVTGKPNRWTITLPDELVKKVKKSLAPFNESDSEAGAIQADPGAGLQN